MSIRLNQKTLTEPKSRFGGESIHSLDDSLLHPLQLLMNQLRHNFLMFLHVALRVTQLLKEKKKEKEMRREEKKRRKDEEEEAEEVRSEVTEEGEGEGEETEREEEKRRRRRQEKEEGKSRKEEEEEEG